MRQSIKREFGGHKPKAIVLDDNANARKVTARQLRGRGFEVVECASASEFFQRWKPGNVDVIIADWQLSHDKNEQGDEVLASVRERDWDVPFVLVSGKLGEDTERAKVLEHLLTSGGARFVERGNEGIQKACDSAEDLIERRDLALLKVILALREGALKGATISTSSGEQSVQEILETTVSTPPASHDAGRPIAKRAAIAKAAR
jgi:CheY-like chemotaxis protein